MITVKPLTDEGIIEEFLLTPQIRDVVLPDADLAAAHEGQFEINWDYDYLGLYKDNNLIGMVKYEYLTEVTAIVHPYVLPKYFRDWIREGSMKITDDWFRENTFIHKYTTTTPKSCRSALKMLHRNGFELEGVLIGGMLWRGKIEDLVLMSKFI